MVFDMHNMWRKSTLSLNYDLELYESMTDSPAGMRLIVTFREFIRYPVKEVSPDWAVYLIIRVHMDSPA